MTGEAFVVSASDIAMEGATRLADQMLEMLAATARDKTPIVVRVDFPGEPSGGFIAEPRRLGRLGRMLWRLGSRPMRVGI